MTITIIRHAQSLYNVDPTNIGDVGLSNKGKIDAKNIVGKYDLIICSSLKRAKETLEYSGLTYDKVIYSDLCREQHEYNHEYNNDDNSNDNSNT